MDEKTNDNWTAGNSYEGYMGRWSRLVAQGFINWLDISTDSQWLDVGCGTGILLQQLWQLP